MPTLNSFDLHRAVEVLGGEPTVVDDRRALDRGPERLYPPAVRSDLPHHRHERGFQLGCAPRKIAVHVEAVEPGRSFPPQQVRDRTGLLGGLRVGDPRDAAVPVDRVERRVRDTQSVLGEQVVERSNRVVDQMLVIDLIESALLDHGGQVDEFRHDHAVGVQELLDAGERGVEFFEVKEDAGAVNHACGPVLSQ